MLYEQAFLQTLAKTYFITSRSDGSSDEISEVSLSRWREDISGKGAELSRPRRDCMSWRIPMTSCGSLPEAVSLSRAGMLFWPTYRVVSVLSGSGEGSARNQLDAGTNEQSYAPYALMASRASLLRLLRASRSSGERALFLAGVGCSERDEMLLPVADLFGL
jgi:hypothetical protein